VRSLHRARGRADHPFLPDAAADRPRRRERGTLDGLDSDGSLHPLQRTFIEEQAAQCAYCVNGIIMGAVGWLRQRKVSGNTSVPSDPEIAAFLSGDAPGFTRNYLCRCGAHTRMIRAISSAAGEVLS